MDRTRDILWPPDRRVWIRIFFLSLFIGGTLLTSFNTDMFGQFDFFLLITNPDIVASYLSLLVIIGILCIVTGLILLYIKSVFSYVFIDVLKNRHLSIRDAFLIQMRRGVQYFVFYVLIMIVASAIIMIIAVIFLIPLLIQSEGKLLLFVDVIFSYLVLSLVALFPIWVVLVIMYDFVIPLMLYNDCSIYTAWEKAFSLFLKNKQKIVIYLIIRIILTLVVTGIIGIISFYLGFLLNTLFTAIPVVYLVQVICSVCVIISISLFLMTPVVTFFRFFSLIFLSQFDTRYAEFNYSEEMKFVN